MINQLHAVSCTQQNRQKKPSVQTVRSSLSAEFRRHCVLSGGTQRRALPRHKSEEMKIYIYDNDFLEWGSNPQSIALKVTLCAPAPRLAS